MLAAIEQDNWSHPFARDGCDMENFVRAILGDHEPVFEDFEFLERVAFYERVMQAIE